MHERALASGHGSDAPRYWAFISYSQKDNEWARWLHRAIEGYRVPKALTGDRAGTQALPTRLTPVFRDREELSSAPDLGERLTEALGRSRYLIVICSPNAARSRWVNEEIRTFKRLGGRERVLAVIVDGEPFATDRPDIADKECFPEALRHAVDATGAVMKERIEPIAADARADKDGKSNALLKLLAGMLGVPFDTLRQRNLERRIRQLTALGILMTAVVLVFAWLMWKSIVAERLAVSRERVAVSRQLAAQSLRLRNTQADLAALLALEAEKSAPTLEAQDSLLNSLIQVPHFLGYLHGPAGAEFSADGTRVAGQDDYGIVIWDLATRKPVGPPLQGSEFGYHLVASPDRKLLANVSSEQGRQEIGLWNFDTGTALGHRMVAPGRVSAMAFGPDSYTLLASLESGGLIAWDARNGQPLSTSIQLPRERVTGLRFSHDRKWLAIQRDNDVLLVDWPGGTQRRETSGGHDGGVRAIAFDPQGRWLVTGGRTGSVMFWDLARQTRTAIRHAHDGAVTSLAFSPDGHTMASSSSDGKILMWHVAQQMAMDPPLNADNSSAGELAFSPDGSMLIDASRGIRLWDARGRKQMEKPIAGIDDPDELAAANPDHPGTLPDGAKILWRHDVSRELGRAFTNVVPDITGLGFARGGVLYAWSNAATVRLNTKTSHPERLALPGMALAVNAVKNIVAMQIPSGIMLWDLTAGRALGTPIPLTDGKVSAAAFSGTGELLVLGLDSGGVMSLSTSHASPPAKAPMRLGGKVWSVAANSDGRYLAAGADDGMPLLWEGAGGRIILRPVDDPGNPLWSLAFNPKTHALTVGNNVDGVTLWDTTHLGRQIALPPSGHHVTTNDRQDDGAATSVAVSPDGELMISGAADGTLLWWRLASGQWVPRSVAGHRDRIQRIAFDVDGKRVASASADGTVVIWDVDPASWRQRACRLANRNLSHDEWRIYFGDKRYETTCPDLPAFDTDCSSVLVNYLARPASAVCRSRSVAQ